MFSPAVTVLLVCSFAPAPLPRPSPACYLGIDAKPGDGGVMVDTIYISAPAGEAGISSGDLILSVDGKPVRSLNELGSALRKSKPGTTVPVVVRRGSDEVRLDVKLAARRDFPYLGVSLGSTTIDDLPEDSPGRKAGLLPGDVILTIDGKPIKTREEVVGAISTKRVGESVDVVVNREGSEKTIPVKLGNRPGY
jgi:S1-C subfamily serine protease